MGRIARGDILYDGCYAHVFSRVFEKRRVFASKDDFDHFKGLLSKTKKKYTYQIHHYGIMQTHFHLVVKIEDVKAFSTALQVLKKSYTEWYNYHHKRFGPLWRDRFKSLLIENEGYLYACGLYVENNPVEAGIVKESVDWPHSSAKHYFFGDSDPLVDDYDNKSLPKDIDITDSDFFVKGSGIGSKFFKLQLRDEIYS
jgi:REP element-mobilizing transposase RayT